MENALLFLCAGTGLLVVAGSLLMIWNGRIVIDREGGSISRVELPFGIRLQTQLPVVMIFLFGAFLLALPLFLIRSKFDQVPVLTVAGKIKANGNYRIYVLAAESLLESDSYAEHPWVLTVPSVNTTNYRVVYFDDSRKFLEEPVEWLRVVNNRYEVQPVTLPMRDKNISTRVSESNLTKEPAEIQDNYKATKK